MIDAQLRGEIRRLFLVEKWKVGTIARQLQLHPSTVRRALEKSGVLPQQRRGRMIDPYLPFIEQVLGTYPRLPASRLYTMVVERGYPGGPDQFRHLVASMRPKPQREAFLSLRMLPGEQAQVDWGHFGRLRVGRAHRRLYAFVFVLSFSRTVFVHFTLDTRLETFLHAHQLAFHLRRRRRQDRSVRQPANRGDRAAGNRGALPSRAARFRQPLRLPSHRRRGGSGK